MTDRQKKLLHFVALKHAGQVRKYTGEPYLNHLLAVAEMADGKSKFGYEVGLCHDLLEDTYCEFSDLYQSLLMIGYNEGDADFITDSVIDLTDIYTPENSPELNRKHRKHLEAIRLHEIDEDSQTVKYCDIIDNTRSIALHDPGFAKVYIPEIEEILSGMDKGNKELYDLACKTVADAKLTLKL